MARSGGRKVSILGFGWESLTRVQRDAESAKKAVKGVEKAILYWMGEEEGGALSKRAANSLCNDIIHNITAQTGPMNWMPRASDWWFNRKTKEKYWSEREGALDDRLGIATGQMVNAIRPINAGAGKWKVGISSHEKVSERIGNIRTIADYARIFEHGSVRQPPRPIFAATLKEWAEEKLEEEIRNTLLKDLLPHFAVLKKLAKKARPEDAGVPFTGRYEPKIKGGKAKEYDEEGRGTPVLTAASAEDYLIAKEESEYLGYDEAERTEEYITEQSGDAIIHYIESTKEVWNWIDQKWQERELFYRRMRELGGG